MLGEMGEKGLIFAVNCASCLSRQEIKSETLEFFQISDTEFLNKTYCPSCKKVMFFPPTLSFMELILDARPPFVPFKGGKRT